MAGPSGGELPPVLQVLLALIGPLAQLARIDRLALMSQLFLLAE